MKLLKAGKRCKKGQTLVSWNQAGPAGPRGVAGAQGAAGATVAGPAGAPAVTLWWQAQRLGQLVASSGVTNVAGNASGRFVHLRP